MFLTETLRVLVWSAFVSKGRKRRCRYRSQASCSPGPSRRPVLSDVHSLLQLTSGPVKHMQEETLRLLTQFRWCHFHQRGACFHFNPPLIIRCLLTEVLWGLLSAKASFLPVALDVSMELSLRHWQPFSRSLCPRFPS